MLKKYKTLLPRLLIFAGAVFLLGSLAFLSYASFYKNSGQKKAFKSGVDHSVVLNSDGFSPALLTINQGDSITFTTTAGKEFWPASDLHPSHSVYPEFDPKQPIEATSSWTFLFNKPGTWNYHDHLFPTRRATVLVLPVDNSTATSAIDCSDQTVHIQECWQQQIDNALNTKGLDAAFGVLSDLYDHQPAFASSCHDNAHRLGVAAYALFAAHKDVELTAKTSYCGFGFYHGFMETLLHTSGDIQQARDFCTYAGDKLSSQTSDADGACYHGIGHGSVDGSDPRAWGDPQAMIDPSLKLCETVANTSAYLYRCITGAYNALEILSADPKYKLDMIVKNPFYLCPSQPDAYKEGCYTNMLPSYMRLYSDDWEKLAKIIEKIPEKNNEYNIRHVVMSALFHEYIRVNLNEPDYNVKAGVALCRKLSTQAHDGCIEGLSGGHMKYGKPEQEYIKGLAFCGSKLLSAEESNICYPYILTRLRIWYTPEKTEQICGTVPEKYQVSCSH